MIRNVFIALLLVLCSGISVSCQDAQINATINNIDYCEGTMRNPFKIAINWRNDFLVTWRNDFVVPINYSSTSIFCNTLELKHEVHKFILSKGYESSIFYINSHGDLETDNKVHRIIREEFAYLNIDTINMKMCYIKKGDDLSKYPNLRPPPPPPPPPHQTTVIEITNDDEDIEILEYDALGDDTPFMIVEHMPALGPCISMRENERTQCTNNEIIRYVSINTKYPSIAKDAGIQGKVYIYFVVGRDGYVRDVRILREVHPDLDMEAKRVIESLPRFEPGQQRGKSVSVQYTIPVSFIIRNSK